MYKSFQYIWKHELTQREKDELKVDSFDNFYTKYFKESEINLKERKIDILPIDKLCVQKKVIYDQLKNKLKSLSTEQLLGFTKLESSPRLEFINPYTKRKYLNYFNFYNCKSGKYITINCTSEFVDDVSITFSYSYILNINRVSKLKKLGI